MDLETQAVIHNALRQARWAADATDHVDVLIRTTHERDLTRAELRAHLQVHRELLVRMSQQQTLLAWALESQRGPWRAWLRMRLAWVRSRRWLRW